MKKKGKIMKDTEEMLLGALLDELIKVKIKNSYL